MNISKIFFASLMIIPGFLFPMTTFGDMTIVREFTSSPKAEGNIEAIELEEQEDEEAGTLQDLQEELKDLKKKLSVTKNEAQKKRINQHIEELQQLIAQRIREVTEFQPFDKLNENIQKQITLYISDNKLRFEMDEIVSIIDLDKNLILNLAPQSKAYQEITFNEWNEMQKQMEEEIRKLPAEKQKKWMLKDVKVTRTEKKQKINGFNCEQYLVTDQTGSEEVWVTKDIAFKEYHALMKKYSETLMGKNPEVRRELEKLHTIEGVPIKVISRSPYRIEITEVKSISTDELDPSLFQVPKGFQKSNPETIHR